MGTLLDSGLRYGSSNKRQLENDWCTSFGVLVKFKRRKVSAVRDFPPGCGPSKLRTDMMSKDTEAVASLDGRVNLMADDKMVHIVAQDSIKTSEMGNESPSLKMVKIPAKSELPDLFDDLVENVKEVQLSPIMKPLGSALPKAIEKNVPDLLKEWNEEEIRAVVKTKGTPESKTALEIGSMVNGMSSLPAGGSKAWSSPRGPIGDANISETAQKRTFPRRRVSAIRDFPPFCGGNAEKKGLIISLGNRTLVDPLEASVQGLLLRETVRAKEGLKSRPPGDVTVECEVDRVIVQGLMVAQNCPWRHGKGGAAMNDRLKGTMTGREVGRLDDIRVERQNKSQSVSRGSVYEADYLGGKYLKKKLLHSGNASNKNKGARILKDEGHLPVQQQDEDSPAGQEPHDVEVILPPFGPNISRDGNARDKVRETLRLFQAICRKLLQGEEAKLRQQGHLSRRIDLQAARIIRERRKEVTTGKQLIGSVPGVEVGDEFQYRVELALVGLHRLYQAGIDSMTHDGKIIATSVVASGAYEDDLENPDVLIYSGQGGNIVGHNKQPEDQKLEKGNLALKNSISAKTPVRVIHGYKEMKITTADSRAKSTLTYTYDGLYTVQRYWQDVGQHGKLVFMFELKRIPGQPEVAWKEVKKSNKSKVREGLCVGDISGGKELFPIRAVNTKDTEKPPKFNYVTKMKYPNLYCPTPPEGCDCIGGCSDAQKCSCAIKNGGEFPYNHNGAIVETKTLVYECGPACKCSPSCHNRVSQHGIKIQLEIFKTQLRGWGVRSVTSIPSGSFICEYVGELLEDEEAERRQNDEYLFDIGQNYSDCSLVGRSSLNPDARLVSTGAVEDSCFTIDAAKSANVGRFFNHSCSPNLYAQNVLYDHEDKRMPHIMLFAAENIPPLQELTYHYNYTLDQVRDLNGEIRKKSCYCGSAVCTGRMY